MVDHNIDFINSTTNNSLSLLDDLTVVLTTTESVTIIETTTETTTESLVVYRTVTADVSSGPSPSPLQNSGATNSNSCLSNDDDDDDNTPIYVAVVIVIVGLLITITAIIVGIFLCRHYWQEKQSNKSSSPLNVKYRTTNDTAASLVSVVEVENDLYGKETLQPPSR